MNTKKTKLMDLNIQKFAEDPATPPADDGNGGKKTLIELLKDNPDYQSEFDKLNAKSIETALTKAREQAEKDKKQAEELAKLSEADKQKKILEDKEKELKEREDDVALGNMRLEAIKILNEKNIDINLVDFVIKPNADETKENIDKLERAFSTAVEKAVIERLKGKAPKDNNKNSNSGNTADFVSVIKENQTRK